MSHSRLQAKYRAAARALRRGEWDTATTRLTGLLATLRSTIEAMQRGEDVPEPQRRVATAVLTDIPVAAFHSARAVGDRTPRTLAALTVAFAEALLAAPNDPNALHNVGAFCSWRGDWRGAATMFTESLRMRRHPATLVDLGFAYARQGDRQAAACWDQALALADASPDPCYAVAQVRLMRGDWARGFRDYEARVDQPFGVYRSRSTRPRWDGQPVDRLLLLGDQGAGDLLMATRYLPWLAAHAQHLIAVVPPSMGRLVEALTERQVTIVPDTDPLPAHDAHVAWMSLPALAGTTVDTVPPPLRRVVVPRPVPTLVGVCWRGDPRHANDHARSLSERQMQRIVDEAAVAGWSVTSLQYGAGVGDAPALAGDWLDTARRVADCGLVITVDTGVAHLAGSLGVPTWLLLPEPAEWRWLRDRSDTPWYPAMRLWRQPVPGDWAAVVETVCAALGTALGAAFAAPAEAARA